MDPNVSLKFPRKLSINPGPLCSSVIKNKDSYEKLSISNLIDCTRSVTMELTALLKPYIDLMFLHLNDLYFCSGASVKNGLTALE